MKRVFVLIVLLHRVLLCVAEDKPKLIIGITIDQFYPEWLYMYEHLLEENGLKRFVNDGIRKELAYDYFYSQTGVDHASIYSGVVPAVHGIVCHDWYDRLKKRRINNVETDNYPEIGLGDTVRGYSPEKLQALTLGCVMKMYNDFSKVYSIGAEAEGAVLSGGSCADMAFWINNKSGKWVSSGYYADSLPTWLNAYNDKNESDYYVRRGWMPLFEEDRGTTVLKMKNKMGIGTGFYYDLAHAKRKFDTYEVLNGTPYANSMVVTLAMDLIKEERLGKDNDTDLLSLNLGSLGYMSRDFDVRSREYQDMVLRLDKDLQKLLLMLDERIGRNGYLVFLTFTEMREILPDELEKMRISGGVFSIYKAVALLKSYLNLIYGEGDWIMGYDAAQIYLDKGLIESRGLRLNDFQDKVAEFIVDFEGVARAVSSHSLTHNSFAGGNEALIQNGFSHKKSGDVLYYLLPNWVSELNDKEDFYFRYSRRNIVPFYICGANPQILEECTKISEIMPSICRVLGIPNNR